MMTKIEMQAMDAVIGIHREMRKANEIDWEQRRYEISIHTLQAMMTGSAWSYKNKEDAAKKAVEYADALIAELKKETV